MKRIILKFGMMVAMLLSFLPASAYDFEVGGIYYDIVSPADFTCKVVQSPEEYSGDIVIPEEVTYNGRQLRVVSIGWNAFYSCGSLTSIKMGNSVTTIGPSAFKDCSSLASIEMGNSVTTIDSKAFSDCSSLASIEMGNSVTTIGEEAFAYCRSLISIKLPNSVTTIGKMAFSGCRSLVSIEMGNSLTTIGEKAFAYCSSLASIKLPNSVTRIDSEVFSDCSSLVSIEMGNSVTRIGYAAFSGCSSLVSIEMGNSVTAIGIEAFRDCSSLPSIKIPDSVTTLGRYSFYGCSSLENIKLSGNLEKLDYGTFYGCNSLSSLTIPGQVTEIILYQIHFPNRREDDLFHKCEQLNELMIEYSSESLLSKYVNDGKLYDEELRFLSEIDGIDKDWVILGPPLPIKKATIDRKLPNSIPLDSLEHYVIGEHIAYNQVELSASQRLETITSYALDPPGGMSNLTNVQYANVIVKVPEESLEAYKNADGWKNFWNIEGIDISGINDVVTDRTEDIYVVYNLQGIMVLKTTNYDDVRHLPAGMYIVNGKKFLSR